MTSGAREGAIAWVAKDLTAKAARMSSWSEAGFENPMPLSQDNLDVAVTDPYVVESLSPLRSLYVSDLSVSDERTFPNSACRVLFEDLDIRNPGTDGINTIESFNQHGVGFLKCSLGNLWVNAGGVLTWGCHHRSLQTQNGALIVVNAGLITGSVAINPTSRITFNKQTLVQGSYIEVAPNAAVTILSCGVMDSPYDAWTVRNGAVIDVFGDAWGSGSGDRGWNITSGGSVSFTSSTKSKITVVGDSGDSKIGGSVKTYAEWPFVNATNLAAANQWSY